MLQNNSEIEHDSFFEIDEDLQALEIRLRKVHPPVISAPPHFRDNLRTRLLHQHHPRKRIIRAGLKLTAAVSLVFALCLVVWTSISPASVSAAEIMRRAVDARAYQMPTTSIIHEQFIVDYPVFEKNDVRRTVRVERWISEDKQQFRYQMVNAHGDIVYLFQRNNNTFWQSSRLQPIEEAPVSEVNQFTSSDIYTQSDELLNQSLGLMFHPLWHVKLQCSDLDCLLQSGVGEAKLVGREQTSDGNEVYVVAMHYQPQVSSGQVADYTLTLKIDTRDYSLIELSSAIDGQSRVIMSQFTREILSLDDVAKGFFSSLPTSVAVVKQITPNDRSGVDHIWIDSASIIPGTTLSESMDLEVHVRYSLMTVPEANVSIGLANGDSFYSFSHTKTSTDTNSLIIKVSVSGVAARDVLQANKAQLYASLELWNDPQSFHVLTTQVSDEYYYVLPSDR